MLRKMVADPLRCFFALARHIIFGQHLVVLPAVERTRKANEEIRAAHEGQRHSQRLNAENTANVLVAPFLPNAAQPIVVRRPGNVVFFVTGSH